MAQLGFASFDSPSVGCDSNNQFNFLRFRRFCLFRSVLCVYHAGLVWDMDSEWPIRCGSVLLVCCLESQPHVCISGLSSGAHRKLCGIPFLSPLLSVILLIVCGFQGLPKWMVNKHMKGCTVLLVIREIRTLKSQRDTTTHPLYTWNQ